MNHKNKGDVAYVVELTYMHYIYLAVIVVVIALMILKHDVVVPCIVGLFVLGFCYSGFSVIGGAQAVFNGMMGGGRRPLRHHAHHRPDGGHAEGHGGHRRG